MDHVAAAAGVSRATVSRVINNAVTVAPGIRDAVERAIAATGYVPNVAARSLVTRRSNSVALVISEPDRPDDHSFLNRIFTDPYFGRVTAGATGALRPHDVHLVVVPTDATDHHQVLRYLRQGHVDGVLLISSHEHDPLPRQVHELGIPAADATHFSEIGMMVGRSLDGVRTVRQPRSFAGPVSNWQRCSEGSPTSAATRHWSHSLIARNTAASIHSIQ